MRAFGSALTCRERDRWFFAIAALSVLLCVYQLSWGLPNGNFSWAADAVGPLSVLKVAKKSLGEFNSGWFWYKYPFGYPLLLLIAYAPYLAWLMLTGQLHKPVTTYPYGFDDPDSALFVLALLGRCVNTALIVGTVVLTYGIACRLLDRRAARLAMLFAATAYPLIFYAHTTNQDAAYMFWLTLAVWATAVAGDTARLREREPRWPYVVLGIAAAMAMATKEQGFALLGALAITILVVRYRAMIPWATPSERLRGALWSPQIAAGLLATAITAVIGLNALINPMGVVNRVLDLTGHPIPGMSSRLTPLKFSLFKGTDKELWYLRQLFDVTESTFGLPLFLCALAGVVLLAWRVPRARLHLLWPMAAYYFVSLRVHDLLGLRYALPLVPLLAVAAGGLCSFALLRWRRDARVAVGVLCVLALARGGELLWLLQHDSRYQAEAYLAAHAPAGASVEYYQKPVYVPRLDRYDAREIPLEQRTLAGIAERNPEWIVLSSAGWKSIDHFWSKEWKQGDLLTPKPEATEFLTALQSDALPYRKVATFRQQPVLLRMRINTLCPEITLYQRQ